MVTGVWSLEMLPERLIDDLGDRQVIEVCLASLAPRAEAPWSRSLAAAEA